MKPRIFLSYSRADRARVSELHGKLERSGFDAWMDRKDITAGDWRAAIKRALRHSNFFLACLSRNTETRGEVLEFEIDSALEVQKDNLEGEMYLIPLRLEPCEAPEKLRHLQWIDLFEPDGFARLLGVLRAKYGASGRRRWVIAGSALVLAAVLGGIWWQRQREPEREEFRESRPGGKLAGVAAKRAMVGITLWKLRPVQASDPPRIRYIVQPPAGAEGGQISYVPVRLATDNLRVKDRIFLAVESLRRGYLYVADREIRTDGSLSAPMLVFPTERVNSGDNELAAGRPVEIPDRFSRPNYFEVQPGASYAGERLTLVVVPQPLGGLGRAADRMEIGGSVVEGWERDWGKGVKRVFHDGGERIGTEGESRAMNGSAALGAGDAAPQMIYAADRKPEEPVAVTVSLTVSR